MSNSAAKIAFVEEARYFYTLLRKMKRNPIKPVTELFQFELNRDSEIWQKILDKEHEIDGLKITILYGPCTII